MGDYLAFRRFITPAFMQVIFFRINETLEDVRRNTAQREA